MERDNMRGGPSPELLLACEKFLHPFEWMKVQGGLVLGAKELGEFVHAREQAAVQLALEEHQAALCPEDYGCKEYIAALQRQIGHLSDVLAQPAAEPSREQAARLRLDEATKLISMFRDKLRDEINKTTHIPSQDAPVRRCDRWLKAQSAAEEKP